jgi:hypothetical protein
LDLVADLVLEPEADLVADLVLEPEADLVADFTAVVVCV